MKININQVNSNLLKKYFDFLQKYMPPWAVFVIDLILSATSVIIAYLLRFNFNFHTVFSQYHAFSVLGLILVIRAISFFVFKTYTGVIRYTSTYDTLRIFYTILSGSVAIFILNLGYSIFEGHYFMPMSVIVIDAALTILFIVGLRLLVRALYFESMNINKLFKNVLIYGGDDYGLSTKKLLERDPAKGFKVIGFIDDHSNGLKIDGKKIWKIKDLPELIKTYNISYIVLSKKQRITESEEKIIDIALKNNVKVLRVPAFSEEGNKDKFKQLKAIRIEDLLEREPIKINTDKISETVEGKKILITGAAGSIGSEIIRQVIKFKPKFIIAIDQAETPLYEVDLEIREKLGFEDIEIIICDVTDYDRLEKIFSYYRPEIVFHAAAYKHVPMMEKHPYEAVKTNVGGTKNLADLADKFKVEKFVYISTDKAVNPTNVMGASKRIGEIYIQSLNKISQTKFITTRFGNVLGSNGSVIPRFRKQIEQGGPVTVTHPDIERYFMTIPEACQLVLEAGAYGEGGEIFVFDMGKPVKIVDLAKKMIMLAGLTPGVDIQISYIGLRPGEKLYEELLDAKENLKETHHEKILKAKSREYEFTYIKYSINQLLETLKTHNDYEIVRAMKLIVPEYKSKNSRFEKLDYELQQSPAAVN